MPAVLTGQSLLLIWRPGRLPRIVPQAAYLALGLLADPRWCLGLVQAGDTDIQAPCITCSAIGWVVKL